jgi:hypothetical protein
VKLFFSRLFIPQESNNYRALLLHPSFMGIFIAVYLLNQSLIRTLTIIKPGILGYSSEITADKVVNLINLERQKLGLSALKLNPSLSQSAKLKAEDMFASDYWAHTSPTGKSPWDFFKAAGYSYSIAGENLAKDFYDTESLMRAWMKSPTHKANIVNNKYQEIGIGVVNGILDGMKTTLVVQHFAAPLVGSVAADSTDISGLQPLVLDTSPLPNTTITPSFNPLTISKIIGVTMFVVIITVLLIDGFITLKNNTRRLTGSSAGHVGFLAIILLLLLFTRQGSIF